MVCRGNICRSPMAEGFFAQQLKNNFSNVRISSAGTHALSGHSAFKDALDVMKQHGIDLSHHRARQINDEIVRQSELILVMSKSHLDAITRQFLSAKGKTFLLGHWHQFEIEDPYTKPYEAFKKVYQQIELAWQEWKVRI
jgi:protein-tyrosine phosphatase